MVTVIRREGKAEEFEEKKLYASVYAAASSSNYEESECEEIAEEVTQNVKEWLQGKVQISSRTLRKKIAEQLEARSETLSFAYRRNLPNITEDYEDEPSY